MKNYGYLNYLKLLIKLLEGALCIVHRVVKDVGQSLIDVPAGSSVFLVFQPGYFQAQRRGKSEGMNESRTNESERRWAIRCTTRMQCERGLSIKWRDKENKKKKKKLERGEEKEAFNRIAPLVYRQNATLSKDVQSEKDREEKKIILTRTWNRKGVVPWSGETESRWERQARKTRLVIHNPPPVEKILSVSRVSSPD